MPLYAEVRINGRGFSAESTLKTRICRGKSRTDDPERPPGVVRLFLGGSRDFPLYFARAAGL